MEYEIKEITCDNLDFKSLCIKLDEFQNNIIPQRIELGLSALDGLEKLKIIFIIYDKDRAIACAGLKPIDDTTAEISRVYTDDNYRGKGLAKMLINKIIEIAQNQGYKKLVLDTWKDSTSARNLYKHLGFVEVPTFDIETLKNSFATDNENILKEIQEKLVFMEKLI